MIVALVLILLVQINFGILPVAQKTVLTSLSPWALFGLRSLAGAASFLLIYKLWLLIRRPKIDAAEKAIPQRVFILLSFLGISANQFLLIMALSLTSSVAAAIIVPSITLFTFLFAILLGRERFTWSQASILTLGGCGVLILFADSLREWIYGLDQGNLYGNLLCVLSAASYALYLVLLRDWVGKLSALQFTSRMFSYAAGWSLIFLAMGYLWVSSSLETWQEFFIKSSPTLLGGTGLVPSATTVSLTLVFIILGPTVLNYFLNFWVLRLMSASSVSGFISLQTLIGATASHFLIQEPMKHSYGLAAICIILSITLLSWRSLRPKQLFERDDKKTKLSRKPCHTIT